MRLIHISGLGRSGTTILDFALGSFDNTISLGETFPLLRDFEFYWEKSEKIACSCGSTFSCCPFWSSLAVKILGTSLLSERYSLLFEHFESFYPSQSLVDSSGNSDKRSPLIEKAQSTPGIELYTIFLTRDVRAWTNSMLKADQRYWQAGKRKRYVPGWVYFVRWYYRNKSILKYLKNKEIIPEMLSYDELILNWNEENKKIAKATNNDTNNEADLSQNTGHVITGNRIKTDASTRNSLRYDYRWMTKYSLNIYSSIFPRIMILNNNLVYPNVTKN